jgi:hypothetical protein
VPRCLLPALESSGKLTPTGLHVCPRQPRLDDGAADIQKDSLTFVLNSRQPGGLTRRPHGGRQFRIPLQYQVPALEREADESDHFATMH